MKVWAVKILCAFLTLLTCSASDLFATTEGESKIILSDLVEKVQGGQIDWGKEMFYAVGEGAVPSQSEEPNRGKALLRATDYAKMDAIANMLMLIEGTSISYSATGKDYMAQDVTLRQKIEGYVKNVVILKREKVRVGRDMLVRVTVGCPIYGHQSPGAALLQKASELAKKKNGQVYEAQPVKLEVSGEVKVVEPTPYQPAVIQALPTDESTTAESATVEPVQAEPAPEEPQPIEQEQPAQVTSEEQPPVEQEQPSQSVPEEGQPSEEGQPAQMASQEPNDVESEPVIETQVGPANATVAYTGLIVDTIGLHVMRAMSPKIRTQGGAEVWGTIKLDPDKVQDRGPVAYVRTLTDALKSPRAGANPLVLKAIGRAGGRKMCDVVLSDEDVEILRAADEAANPSFLKQMNVVFVVDPM